MDTPEEQIASLIIRRFGLTPPIDVVSLISQVADIEEDTPPGDCDALFLGKPKDRTRPLIILNKKRNPLRKRFTLAHELGHLKIPWHIGTFFCHTSYDAQFKDSLYYITETEANKFAAELLMPSAWLMQSLEGITSVEEAFNLVKVAKVSDAPIVYALGKMLDPGFVIAAVKEGGEIIAYATTPGTHVRASLPSNPRLSKWNKELPKSDDSGTFDGVYHQIHWWWYKQSAKVPKSKDGRTSKDILSDILSSPALGFDEAERKAKYQSLMAIVAAANKKNESEEQFYSRLQFRFLQGKKSLGHIMAHPDWQQFLAKRCREIKTKK